MLSERETILFFYVFFILKRDSPWYQNIAKFWEYIQTNDFTAPHSDIEAMLDDVDYAVNAFLENLPSKPTEQF